MEMSEKTRKQKKNEPNVRFAETIFGHGPNSVKVLID